MIKVLFICHGNICRSPMAEFIFKDMIKKQNLTHQFQISSAATSTEEIWNGVGNPVYPPAKKELAKHGISCEGKRAVQVKKFDYKEYDYLIVMDTNNLRWLNMRMPSIVQYRNGRYADPSGKIRLLMTLAGREADVADPWYTGNFNRTYRDICEALTALLEMN